MNPVVTFHSVRSLKLLPARRMLAGEPSEFVSRELLVTDDTGNTVTLRFVADQVTELLLPVEREREPAECAG